MTEDDVGLLYETDDEATLGMRVGRLEMLDP